MSKSSKEKIQEEVKLEMTPMIDVTFLLLIFFMCLIKFKMLEGKLAAYLPKDVGVNNTPIEEPLEKIDLRITVEGESNGKDPLGRTVGKRKLQNVKYWIGGSGFTELEAFKKRLQYIRSQQPELKATLAPSKEVLTDYVVKLMDACLAIDLTDITFKGSSAIR
ncbi:MAG: biopolymer transporter ExbD [Planctomycetota bacterium]